MSEKINATGGAYWLNVLYFAPKAYRTPKANRSPTAETANPLEDAKSITAPANAPDDHQNDDHQNKRRSRKPRLNVAACQQGEDNHT